VASPEIFGYTLVYNLRDSFSSLTVKQYPIYVMNCTHAHTSSLCVYTQDRLVQFPDTQLSTPKQPKVSLLQVF